MDVFSKKKRSEIMSKIRSKDTKIEILFRKALWKKGFRYRKNSNKYFGKPDLVLPKSNLRYWRKKIERNKERDKKVGKYYKKLSWKIFRIWEHNLFFSAKYIYSV